MTAAREENPVGGPSRRGRPGAAPLVLVVDDNNDIREMMGEALEQVGYRVSTAANGALALEQARAARPDLVVLDLMMPVMSGWEFMEAQRRDPGLAGVPVVVVTAATDAAPAGAAAFMRKPFGLNTLLTTVARLCGGGDALEGSSTSPPASDR